LITVTNNKQEQTIIMAANNLSPIEKIKVESEGLRGTIKQSLQDELTGAIR
jgi:sulfite reductase (NADPH) hemoprotein beta-component